MNYFKKQFEVIVEQLYKTMSDKENKSVDPGQCKLKVGVIRNYDVTFEELYEESEFEGEENGKSFNLHKDQINKKFDVNGGLFDNGDSKESIAIEEALMKAVAYIDSTNKDKVETPLTQIILISSAGSNNAQEFQEYRAKMYYRMKADPGMYGGVKYWEEKNPSQWPFDKAFQEFYKLSDGQIPIHTLYTKETAKGSLEWMSQSTKGTCLPMIPASADSNLS